MMMIQTRGRNNKGRLSRPHRMRLRYAAYWT